MWPFHMVSHSHSYSLSSQCSISYTCKNALVHFLRIVPTSCSHMYYWGFGTGNVKKLSNSQSRQGACPLLTGHSFWITVGSGITLCPKDSAQNNCISGPNPEGMRCSLFPCPVLNPAGTPCRIQSGVIFWMKRAEIFGGHQSQSRCWAAAERRRQGDQVHQMRFRSEMSPPMAEEGQSHASADARFSSNQSGYLTGFVHPKMGTNNAPKNSQKCQLKRIQIINFQNWTEKWNSNPVKMPYWMVSPWVSQVLALKTAPILAWKPERGLILHCTAVGMLVCC